MSNFRIEEHPVVFLKPRLSYPYAWVGHVPFAYLLVDVLRPRTYVELGTDSGNSYLAVCQAVAELGTDTHCTAIDSWQGDPHARHYGEGVYETLKRYHDPRYAAFSRLHRSFFIEALGEFEDRSIDLLHIDGLHTYEAVSEDFNTWLPKLSDRAVVILHDTQVRERGFGVARFLDELRSRYRIAEFEHSNGLGIVLVGNHVPKAFLDFMDAFDERPAQIRGFFKNLGDSLVNSDGHVGAPRAELVTPYVTCRIYYRAEGESFDDARTVLAELPNPHGEAALELVFPDGVRPAYLRIDPADHPGVFGLASLRLGVADVWTEMLEFRTRVRHVSGDLLDGPTTNGLTLVAFGEDPHLELAVADLVASLPPAGALKIALAVDYSVVVNTPSLWPLMRAQDKALQEVRQALATQVRESSASGAGPSLADIATVLGAAEVAGILLVPGGGPRLYVRGPDQAFETSRSVVGQIIGLADAVEVRFDISAFARGVGIRLDMPSLGGTYRIFGLIIDGVEVADLRRRVTAVHGQMLEDFRSDVIIVASADGAPFVELDVADLDVRAEVRVRTVREFRTPWMESFVEDTVRRLEGRMEDSAEARFAAHMAASARATEDLKTASARATEDIRREVAELVRLERERGLLRRVWRKIRRPGS